jgi:hypothetical protein
MTATFERIPQQEVFLEYEDRNSNKIEIGLDELEKMNDETLKGFIQWLAAKTAALESEKEARLRIAKHPFESKPLMFKIRIHKFFLNEARMELRSRKEARKEWLKSFGEQQKGNEPCHWLSEFGLPTTYSAMLSTKKKANKIVSCHRQLVNLVTKEAGPEKANQIIKESGILDAGESEFMVAAAQLRSDSHTAVFINED